MTVDFDFLKLLEDKRLLLTIPVLLGLLAYQQAGIGNQYEKNGKLLEENGKRLAAIEAANQSAAVVAKEELIHLRSAINSLQKEIQHLPTKLEVILLKKNKEAD